MTPSKLVGLSGRARVSLVMEVSETRLDPEPPQQVILMGSGRATWFPPWEMLACSHLLVCNADRKLPGTANSSSVCRQRVWIPWPQKTIHTVPDPALPQVVDTAGMVLVF